MTTLTQEQVSKTAHIPTDEVKRDIADTEAEILDLTRKLANIEAMPFPTRLDDMRRSTYRSGIAERRAFVDKLWALLDARATPTEGGV